MGSLASSAGSLVSGMFSGGGGGNAGGAMGSILTNVLGTGLSVAGNLQSGKEDAAALNYRAGLYREAADASRIAGNYDEGLKKAETTRRVNEQTAAFAGNGIDVGSRTVANVTSATQFAGDLDAAMMHYNAAREAYGYDTSAALYSQAAKNAKKKGKLDALGSLISGATSIAGKWDAFKQSGAIGGGGGGGSSPADSFFSGADMEL